jgi:RNA polymerase sigma-70 factor (ECF subfamily)
MPDIEKEREIYERIKAGDMTACDECVEMHRDGLYRLAYRMMKNHEEAEDIVQESFLNAFKGIDKFDGRARLGTWLYRITYNTALMHLRKNRPQTVPVDEFIAIAGTRPVTPQILDLCCLPESDYLRSEALSEIKEAVGVLSESLHSVFWAREVEGLSTRETAELLGIGESAVKVRLHRARNALRDHLMTYFGIANLAERDVEVGA